ncbi:MAG: tRNA threonylcarbamoyl adenosine modification protein YjeE [Parcubacteria bacterium C7867-003]|nr:MAG: tRNA threonylcarbamoyl adenosine modification protein YjeE [Parcubacteria bacterium C7867-003]
MKHLVNNLEETEKVAQDFVAKIVPNSEAATVVGLYGDLGAGKTNFTQAVAKVLGVNETIVSPTFVIEKIYELTNQKFSHLIHIDAYRLESSQELLNLGWQKIITDPKNLILIEWPERVADIMPEHVKISLKHLENQSSREIEIVM